MIDYVRLPLLSLILTGSILSSSLGLAVNPTQEQLLPNYNKHKLKALEATINYFEALFLTQYGPIRWKEQQWGWNPQMESRRAKQSLQQLSDISFDGIKPIFTRFLASAHDGHVNILYTDDRTASIPLSIRLLDNRVRVTASEVSGLRVGDEITHINGMPILDYISQTFYAANWSEAPVARPLVYFDYVFNRRGDLSKIPKDDEVINIKFLQNGIEKTVNTFWLYSYQSSYKSEPSSEATSKMPSSSAFGNDVVSMKLPNIEEISALQAHTFHMANPAKYSSRRKERESFWYIKEVNGKRIGYFNLPDFDQKENVPNHYEVFERALAKLRKNTDALIIDIRDNGGGAALVCFAMLQRLTDKPLLNILESTILDEDAALYAKSRAAYYKTVLDYTNDETWIHEYLWDGEDHILGYYLSMDYIKDMHMYYEAVCDEWDSGNTCTRFLPAIGLTYIEPHPYYRYSKPLYVMINESSASCGDVFPTILKDNNRATLIGRTTSGAGGVVKKYTIPNFTGIELFSLTASLLLRNNQMVIEDLGIDPHYECPYIEEFITNPKLELEGAFEFVAKDLLEKKTK